MATVDARLINATFYDVTRFDIVEGHAFTLTLLHWPGESRWVSENDPVLEIKVTPDLTEVVAKALGVSTIFILEKTGFGEQPKVIKELLITVVAEIIQPVSSLGLSATVVAKSGPIVPPEA